MQFTVTVTNNGPTDASDVLLEDFLPASVTFVSATPDQGTCLGSDVTVSCDLGDIAVNGVVVIIIQVIPTVDGTFINTVTVSFPGIDPDDNNNTATAQFTVVDGLLISGGSCQLGPHAGSALPWLGLGMMGLFTVLALRFSARFTSSSDT